jgi:hypothetical protein
MPFPNFDASLISWVEQQVVCYIEEQRQTFRGRAVPLAPHLQSAMQPFFRQATLDSTHILVLNRERIDNPHFYQQLVQMGLDSVLLPSFEEMAAITLVDTIVFQVRLDPRTLFHELVHVIQYEKLGLRGFATKYVRGFLAGGSYWEIPLERNAYELDTRFTAEPTRPFSVQDEVQMWIDRELF